jgi:26S proteasome regulatory subunit N1
MAEKSEKVTEDLSEEDQALKEKLNQLVSQLQESTTSLQSLTQLESEVRNATTSMTSIPKPLKFLKAHYQTLKSYYSHLPTSPLKTRLSNFISVLAMTMGNPEGRETLQYLLEGDISASISWGHEYVRSLCGEIQDEYNSNPLSHSSLLNIVEIVLPFLIKSSGECEAIDLLQEVDVLEKIVEYVDADNYKRICDYISTTALYAVDPDDMYKTLNVCFQSYLKVNKYPEALRIALKINRPEEIETAMKACSCPVTLKQMCYLLARNKYNYEVDDPDMTRIISNEFLSQAFIKLATDLDVLQPKVPEDIYKSHLEERPRGAQGSTDTAKQNLANTIVNALVNVAYCNDNIMLSEEKKWLGRHKDWANITASSSLGMLLLWNLEEGTSHIDKYQYSRDEYIKSGSFMAFGIANAGIRNENDPVFALLTDQLDKANDKLRVGIISGLSIAYAGARREDVLEVLSPLVIDTSVSLENSALAALGLGLVFVGTCNEDVAQSIIQTLMERSETELKSPYAKFFALGIGLVFLGQQDRVATSLSIIKDLIKPEIKQYAIITAESCAYAGSGNVLKVQEMLKVCAEHLEEKDWQYQMVAVIGVSLISMGENIGVEMVMRTFDNLLQYGTINIRRATPLAMALLCISNPQVNMVDILSKLSHDPDSVVAQCAIFAIGMIGAGTNNSRVAGILRLLAGFYSMDENQLFMVRIAQGLLHLGKGLMTLDPYQSGRFLLSPVALGGILTVLHMMLDIEKLLHEHAHYLIYYLACAIYPRMLVTVDEELNPLPVQVRVGQAVDTVGQAGNPRTITGFQTHTTPVLLSYGEKVELATEEYIPYCEVLENFIILKKNPSYKPE